MCVVLFSKKMLEENLRVTNEHLLEFEELCSGLEILGMIQEALRWKLFPFSLIERAEQWYTRMIGNMSGDWEEVRDDFCYSFSFTKRIDSLPTDILDFEKLEESIGAAWARFLRLLASSPDLSLPEDVSLNIFCSGLGMESALKLDITAGGSFAQKLPTEGREILDFLLANSSFPTDHNEPIQQECESRQKELLAAESCPSTSTPVDSAIGLTPDTGTLGKEEIQPPKFCVRFEDEPLRNIQNT